MDEIRQIHEISGVQHTPINKDELSVELNFDSDSAKESVTLSEYEWYDEAFDLLWGRFLSGSTGGVGIREGLDHTITVKSGNLSETFNLTLDLRNAEFDLTKRRVVAESRPKAEFDWFEKKLDSKTFQYIAEEEGLIPKSYDVWVPYVISSVPDYKESFIVTLSIVVISIEAKDPIIRLTGMIQEIATVIDTLGGVLGLVSTIIYIVFLFLTIIELLLDLVALIIQKVKYFPGMKLNDLLSIACQSFGLKYESPVLQAAPWDKLVIIPETLDTPKNVFDSRIKGFFSPAESDRRGYYKGTPGDLFREITDMFVLRTRVRNGVVTLLPRITVPNDASFTLKAYDENVVSSNGKDLIANFNLSFLRDLNDKNTYTRWEGTNVGVTIQPKIIEDQQNVQDTTGMVKQFAYARALGKKELTGPENIADVLLKGIAPILNAGIGLINKAIDIINKVGDFIEDLKNLPIIGKKIQIEIDPIPKVKTVNTNIITNRIGMMLSENDFVDKKKMVLIDIASDPKNNKVSTLNETYLRAKYFYEQFYRQLNTQFLNRSLKNVEMDLTDVKNVKDEQALKLQDGRVCKLLSVLWNVNKRTADLKFQIPYIYDTNQVEVIKEPKDG